MSNGLTRTPEWLALQRHREAIAAVSMRQLFAEDAQRFDRFSIEAAGLLLDGSKNRITRETLEHLHALARAADVEGWRERMFRGEPINGTEGRAVLHVALRAPDDAPFAVGGSDVMAEVSRVRARMLGFAETVRDGTRTGITGKPFTNVVNIGIGGSDLGPAMVTEALAPERHPRIRPHFVSNVDGTHLSQVLDRVPPDTTLFIVASKTFTTQETLANATSARDWLCARLPQPDAVARHFVALSTNLPAVERFGIAPDAVFGFWDWVGGRYSLWSAIGLPIAIAIGADRFQALLAGAHAMDRHFREAPLAANMPVRMALTGIWAINFWDAPALAILPYDQLLARFPAFLQQLDMESNGKRVDRNGTLVDYPTGPIVFGEPGTNGQHAFYQLIHQGPRLVACDVIAAAESRTKLGAHHQMLLANALAQTQALMQGRTRDEARDEMLAAGRDADMAERLAPHRTFPGDRPSNTILMRRLEPATLGALIALYEHKVFVQSVIWRINAFDQWGVELGKQLAGPVLARLHGGPVSGTPDGSTAGLLRWLSR